jgi:ElaB/YqjD/DUF883 family membrane-anchored ribosome-binding protein
MAIVQSDTRHRIDEAVDQVERAIRTARKRAQDLDYLRHEFVHRVRQSPVAAISIAFGAGMLIGVVAGAAAGRRRASGAPGATAA